MGSYGDARSKLIQVVAGKVQLLVGLSLHFLFTARWGPALAARGLSSSFARGHLCVRASGSAVDPSHTWKRMDGLLSATSL